MSWFPRKPRTSSGSARPPGGGGAAFTLLELMLAVSLLAAVMTVTYMSFSVVVAAWRGGTAMAEELHHGDFVMSQLAMALRSAYYPDVRGAADGYGFTLDDRGDGLGESDAISWVKLGGALVGTDSLLAGSPHRVEFTVAEDPAGDFGAAVKAWRVHGQLEDFDPEDLDPFLVSKRVSGFNCRVTAEEKLDEKAPAREEGAVTEDEVKWEDEWEDTNRIPRMVELTLYLEPASEGKEPIEIKRVVDLPVAALCWGEGGGGSRKLTKDEENATRRTTSNRTSARRTTDRETPNSEAPNRATPDRRRPKSGQSGQTPATPRTAP